MKSALMFFALIVVLVLAGGIHNSYAQPSMMEEPHMDTSSNQSVAYLTGKVVETMDSGGYTYFSIKNDGKEIWAAIAKTELKVGQEVSFRSGNVMYNFPSKTLGRTFETIIFTSGIVDEAEKKAKASASEGMPLDSTHGVTVPSDVMQSDSTHGVIVPDKKVEKIKVEKADGPNAYTVAELHAKRSELDLKSVVLKGQVVKVGLAIMGKNWIHIQDGSGSASDGTNDIIVTSQETPSVGAVVTTNGTLYKDKDFGMGYFFAVIIEEGSFK